MRIYVLYICTYVHKCDSQESFYCNGVAMHMHVHTYVRVCVYFPLLNFSLPVYSSRMALPVHTCVRTYIRIYMYVYLHEYVLCIQASYCISQILCMVSCSQALPSVCTVSLLNSQNIICGICGASQGCFIYRHFCENLNKTHTTRYVLHEAAMHCGSHGRKWHN